MIKRIRKSLTLKWMIFSILLATIPLAIAGFSIIQIYHENLKKSVITIQKEKAQMVVEKTEAFFEKVISNLLFLARDENFRKAGVSHTKGHLENILYHHDYLVELTLLDEKGQETIKISKYNVFGLSDLKRQSKSEMFGVASKGRIYYGEFYLTKDIVPTMVISVPIEEYRGEQVGVLSAKVHLRYLWNLIPQTQIGKKGITYVVDKEGDLIAHPDTRRVLLGLNVRHLPMVNQVVQGKEGDLEFEYPRGEKYLAAYKPIKDLGWGVIVQVPVEEAYAPLRQVANTALKWILIALSIAIIFSLFLTRKLTHPIKQLSHQMGKVSQGNLDVHIVPTTKDELGLLTESFNQMIQDLKQSHEALKKAEEKYRRIFEDSKDMVYITSVDGEVLDVNQAGVDLFGYGSKEEMLQVYVRDTFLNPEDRKRFRNEIRKEWFVKDFEVKLKRKDGTPIDVLITANARRDDSGKIISYEGIIKDISDRKGMEEKLVQRTRELEILYDMSGLINQSLDLDTVLRTALEKALSVTGFEAGAIHLLKEDGETLELKYHIGQSDILAENIKYFKIGEGVAGKAVQLKRPMTFSIDEYPTPRIIPILREEGIQSFVGIPLLAKNKAIGSLTLTSQSIHQFTQREINLLESLGNQIGLALENVRLFEETKKRLDELTILYEITKISTSSLNLDLMLREIINSLNNFFKFEALGILLIDENTKRLSPHPASYQELLMKNIGKLGLCIGKGITGWVAEKGEPLLVDDVREDARYICGDENIRSEMCAPLKVGGKIIGVIDAQSRKLNAFSEDDLRLLNIAAGQIATITENIRLQDEIKQSEEKYRTVVEGTLDGVCVIGIDYRFKYVNEKLAEIQGYSREELIGMDFRNYLDEESKSLLADREDQRKKGIKLLPHFELNIIRKDGGVRNAEISARSIKDSKGNVNIIVILKDITEKKRMEEQLFQSEKLRAVGEMASGVAHDFNNALAAILGNAQLLLYTAKDKSIKESLKVIEKVARDSAQTVRRLQNFTRKKVYEELFKVDVNSIIKDSIEITKPKWKDEVQSRGIHIEMVSNFDKVPLVLGNASEMREVIANMIFNAIEAMPEGGKIEIQTFQRKEKTYIQISDTGIGMTEEVRKKVFEPFFTTKPFSNTGLGLSMSYGIVKRFGGEIEVESKVGKGTTFTIILPVGQEGKEEVAVSPTIQKRREARILVIDDEETVRNVLSQILSQINHRVTVAENGEEGIRLFKEKEFDIVLTDLGMPGMSGWEVGRAIKKMSSHTPVGMITGWGVEVDQAKIEENGIDFVIPKPFQLDQIVKVVDETIASRGSHL
jgi:PAS domain S-box-containing protein